MNNMSDTPSNVHFNDTNTEDELTIDWDSVTGADSYYVYESESSGSSKSDYTQIANPLGPPYTVTNLEDGEKYFYRLSSYRAIADDFEDGDISEYSGDTSVFELTETSPLEGDRSLRSTEDVWNGIVSTSGLPEYPAKGQEFSYLVELRGSETATTPLWGATDLNNYYGFRLDNRTTNQNINVRSNGSSNLTTLFTASPNQGQTYQVVVEWHDGTGSESDNTIVVTVYEYDTSASERGAELGSGSIVDSTHATDTGLGFRTFGNSGNTENIYDLCEILSSV